METEVMVACSIDGSFSSSSAHVSGLGDLNMPYFLQLAVKCYICLLEYEEGDSMRIFACNHEFHRTCIDKWLKEKKSITWVVVTLHMLELPKDDAGIKYSLLVQQPLEWHASACWSREIDNICEIMVDGFPDYHMETSNPIDGFPDYHTNSATYGY
ncbi:hypothetical protein GOBAR_DD24969 [Gossypium barbadense]|nr:hypothetical protein GOBAR_DD24969 [Gossypium barbadense]